MNRYSIFRASEDTHTQTQTSVLREFKMLMDGSKASSRKKEKGNEKNPKPRILDATSVPKWFN